MRNDGEIAQGLIQSGLVRMEQKFKASWVRLYDSKSAGFSKGGNIIPEQFSDYIVAANGSSFLLEAKSSNVKPSLINCGLKNVFKPLQISGAILWIRSGNRAFAAFHFVGSEAVEFWDMSDVIPSYRDPKKHPLKKQKPVVISGIDQEGLAVNIFNLNK
jgi:hypothetical protein